MKSHYCKIICLPTRKYFEIVLILLARISKIIYLDTKGIKRTAPNLFAPLGAPATTSLGNRYDINII